MTSFKNRFSILSLILCLVVPSIYPAAATNTALSVGNGAASAAADTKTELLAPVVEALSIDTKAYGKAAPTSLTLAQLYQRGRPVCTHTLDNNDGSPITALHVINSNYVATGNANGVVRVWNLQNGFKCFDYTTYDKSAVTALASMRSYLIIGTKTGKLISLNRTTGVAKELFTYFGCINSIFPIDDKQFVVGTHYIGPDLCNAVKLKWYGFCAYKETQLSSLSAIDTQFLMKLYPCSLWNLETSTQSLINFNDDKDVVVCNHLASVSQLSRSHNGILAKIGNYPYLLKWDSENGMKGARVWAYNGNTQDAYLEWKPNQLIIIMTSRENMAPSRYPACPDKLKLYYNLDDARPWVHCRMVDIGTPLVDSGIALAPNGYLVILYRPKQYSKQNSKSFEHKISIVNLENQKPDRDTKVLTAIPLHTWTCLNEEGRWITSFAVSPDGRIVTVDNKGRTCVWEFQVPS